MMESGSQVFFLSYRITTERNDQLLLKRNCCNKVIELGSWPFFFQLESLNFADFVSAGRNTYQLQVVN